MIENLQEDRKRQVITDFSGGLHDSIDPIKLEENQFQVMNNAVMFHHTGVKSLIGRNGFRPFNTKAPATGSVTSVINVHEYIKNDGTAVLLAKTNLSLEKIASPYTGTYTAIDGTDSADKQVKMLTYKDLAYIFDRNNGSTWYTNKVYDGTTLYDFGIAPCDNSGLVITKVTGTSLFPDGWYNYYVTFLYDDDTESSVYLYGGVNLTTKQLLVTPSIRISGGYVCGIQIFGIPVGSTRVTARKIYRTKVGGTTFYYLNTIHNNTDTAYFDTTSDDDELTEELTLPTILRPQISKCAVVHKKRLFNANLKDDLTFSAPTIVSPPVGGDNDTTPGLGRSKSTDLLVPYRYAKMYIHPITRDSYAIIRGDLTASDEVATLDKDATESKFGKVTHAIPSWTEPFNGYTGVFRSPHFAVVSVTRTSGVCRVVIDASYPSGAGGSSTYLTEFTKVGDVVYIYGVTSGTLTMADGLYTVLSIDSTSGGNDFTVSSAGDDGSSANYTGGAYIKDQYRLVGVVKAGTTSFVDTIFDCNISNNIYNHNSVTNIDSNKNYPQTIIWTDSEKSEIFTGEDLLNNETGAITGLFSEDDGVVIFKEDSIYKLFTNGDSQYWVTKQLVKNIGCSLIYSVVQLPNNKYIFFSNNKFYLWSSGFNDPVDISLPIRNALNSLALTDVYGAYYGKLNWAVFTTSNVNTVFVYDLNFNKWYKFTNNTFTGGASLASLNLYIPYETKAGTLLLGSKVARLYNYDLTSYVDNLYNESFIDCPTHFKLQTKDFDNYFLDIDKIMAKMYYSGTKVTSGFIMTPHKNLVAGADITKDIANGNSRVGGSVNIQDTQQFSILTEGNISNLFELKGLAFEYTDKGVEGGWYYES